MPSATAQPNGAKIGILRLRGHVAFRQRLVLACLTGRSIRIDAIRSDAAEPGLKDFEAGFLRLLEKITNGSVVEIGYTGTAVSFKPGTIAGGKVVHDCGTSRPIGYFLEWIAVLAPFAKQELSLTLRGITTGEGDLGVDVLRTVTLPLLSQFLPQGTTFAAPLELRVLARGMPPAGGGSVQFRCPLLPTTSGLKTLNFSDPGRIRRMRGVASAARVSPNMASRMVDASRGVLGRYIPDLYVFADVFRGEEAGRSPGYALSLVSTSTTGAAQCAEALSMPGVAPEDVAIEASRALLSEIARGGCVGRAHQSHALLLMALGPEDVSRVQLGQLTPAAIQMLRDVRDFTNVRFKITPVQEEASKQQREELEDENEERSRKAPSPQLVTLSCVGCGVRGARKAA